MREAMQNNLHTWVLVLLLVVLPTTLLAKIPDDIVCSNCHTMHNSQAGESMTSTSLYGLLLSTCSGCHTGLDGTSPIVANTQAPAVMQSSSPPGNSSGSNNMLAGGSFYWVATTGGNTDNTGHNVIGLSSEDADLGTTPPGNGGTPLGSQLTCAGSRGCHGNSGIQNEVQALKAHHQDDTAPLDGSSVGMSYRFLSSVIGSEDADWEYTYASDDHNQYKGGAIWNSAATDTITSVCARCHGDYHGNPGVGTTGASPWVRHPTDIDLSTYGGEFANYITYEVFVPVASTSGLTLVDSNVQTAGNGIVTCISCHRAHGSQYDSIMRWDYRAWPGTVDPIYGCGVCHSSKN